MTYISVSGSLRWPIRVLGALLCLGVAACGSDPATADAGGGGSAGTQPPQGCAITNFRGEPDLLSFPRPPVQASPGSAVEFTIYVDSDTRYVKATFMGAYRLDPEAFPQTPSQPVIMNTATGDESIDFAIPIDTTGRYYVEIELCGSSCDELRVLYTLDRAFAGVVASETPELQPINNPYERILYQNGVETSSSVTCDKPRSVAIQS